VLLELMAGLLAGGIHAISGPDHLAAVAPFAVRHAKPGPGPAFSEPARPGAGRLGLQWGLGHALGVITLGLAGWLLREWAVDDGVAIELWSGWAERGVGIVLVCIGLWALRTGLRSHLHSHEHSHDGETHAHVHLHPIGEAHPPAVSLARPGGSIPGEGCSSGERSSPGEGEVAVRRHGHAHTHAAFAVGALHGVAGTAHLVGVVPALALPSLAGVGVYLLGYGLGAAAAMGVFGWIVGAVARSSAFDGSRVYRVLVSTAGVFAILTGMAWMTL